MSRIFINYYDLKKLKSDLKVPKNIISLFPYGSKLTNLKIVLHAAYQHILTKNLMFLYS